MCVYLSAKFGVSSIILTSFCGNSRHLQAVSHFCGKAPSQMFERILDATLPNNLLQLAEGQRSFFFSGLTQGNPGITLPPSSLYLHETQNQKIKSWTDQVASYHFPETVHVFSNRTPIAMGLTICKYSTHTKLHHLARDRSEGKLLNLCGNKRKSWAHLHFSFP